MRRDVRRRKHSRAEIAAKLNQADQLLAEGKFRDEVTRALGVSNMTYHRWRKAQGSERGGEAGSSNIHEEPGSHSRHQSMEELRIENARLRNLFTDVVLEKIKLEDELRSLRAKMDKGSSS
jgi:putative transposase